MHSCLRCGRLFYNSSKEERNNHARHCRMLNGVLQTTDAEIVPFMIPKYENKKSEETNGVKLKEGILEEKTNGVNPEEEKLKKPKKANDADIKPYICPKCGSVFPYSRPSKYQRKNHKKHCEKGIDSRLPNEEFSEGDQRKKSKIFEKPEEEEGKSGADGSGGRVEDSFNSDENLKKPKEANDADLEPYVCPKCGWLFPNSQPTKKQRKNHKKRCGKGAGSRLPNVELSEGDQQNKLKILEEEKSNSRANGSRERVEDSYNGDVPKKLEDQEGNNVVDGSEGRVEDSCNGDVPEKLESEEAVGKRGMVASFINDANDADFEPHVCPKCGWLFPNSQPTKKQRKNHKKRCEKGSGSRLPNVELSEGDQQNKFQISEEEKGKSRANGSRKSVEDSYSGDEKLEDQERNSVVDESEGRVEDSCNGDVPEKLESEEAVGKRGMVASFKNDVASKIKSSKKLAVEVAVIATLLFLNYVIASMGNCNGAGLPIFERPAKALNAYSDQPQLCSISGDNPREAPSGINDQSIQKKGVEVSKQQPNATSNGAAVSSSVNSNSQRDGVEEQSGSTLDGRVSLAAEGAFSAKIGEIAPNETDPNTSLPRTDLRTLLQRELEQELAANVQDGNIINAFQNSRAAFEAPQSTSSDHNEEQNSHANILYNSGEKGVCCQM